MAHNTYRDKGAKQSDNAGSNLSTHRTYVDKGALNAQIVAAGGFVAAWAIISKQSKILGSGVK